MQPLTQAHFLKARHAFIKLDWSLFLAAEDIHLLSSALLPSGSPSVSAGLNLNQVLQHGLSHSAV